MSNRKYLLGLILIICVVWLTMILCLIIVYSLLPSMELLSITYFDTLILAVVKLLVAGFVLLVWLYSWNMLVKFYFERNLNQSEMKRKEPSAGRKKGNTRVRHIPRKPTS